MSPNGEAPDFEKTPQALAAIWGHVCAIRARMSDLPCKDHVATIGANRAAVVELKAQTRAIASHEDATTARWKLMLDYGWKIAVMIATLYFGGKEVQKALSGTADHATPHVTTSVPR